MTAFRALEIGDAEAVAQLARAAFDLHIGPDWSPNARARFHQDATAPALAADIAHAHLALGAFEDGLLQAFVILPRPGFLRMLFVAPAAMRRGLGRALWERARQHLEATEAHRAITVELNASRFAAPFYRALGFVPLSRECLRDGAVTSRMACWLPARALHAECIDRSD